MCRVSSPRSRLLTVVAVLAILTLLTTSCALAREAPSAADKSAGDAYTSASAPNQGPSLSSTDQPSANRMVIRTANLSAIVTDVDNTLQAIAKVATDLGGFVVSSDSGESGSDRVGQVTIRVPSASMDDAISRVKGLAQRVTRSTTGSQDVTEQYVDQDAHLRNLQATESAYLNLMKTAQSTTDIVTIQQSLSDVRDQIERTQAQLQYLQRSTDLASISVSLATSAAAQPIESREWSVLETVRQAAQALVDVAIVLATLLIYILVLAPVWGIAYVLFRLWRRSHPRRAPMPPTPQPPAAQAG